MNNLFNLTKFAKENSGGRTPIKERGIAWKEAYEERSLPLKKRFEKSLGPGSYHRWRGHDNTTNSEYFIIVGPSMQKGVGKMFFAGIKKVPMEELDEVGEVKAYSPYGEYFPSMMAALSYASERWAVPMPKNQVNYSRNQLAMVDIPEHIKA